MATGFVLRAYLLDDSSVSEHRFGALPIRIGRNPLNDYHIKQGFVSDFHARIEEIEGKIYVRDLGSRNGVFLRGSGQDTPARIEAQTPIELGPYGYEFFLGPLLRLKLDFVQDDAASFRQSVARGSVLGNPEMLAAAQASHHPSVPPFPPAAPGVDPYGAQQFGGAPPGALPSLPGLPPGMAPGLPPGMVPGTPSGVTGDPAAYGSVPTIQPVPQAGYQPYAPAQQPAVQGALPGGRPERRTSQFSMDLDSLAMQGLRELAGSLVPNQPLATTGDVARLITKLHDAIEVFCRCFIPMREGYAQFVSAMDLERAAMQRSQHRSRAYVAIETAKDPGTVAAALLDWRDQSLDAPKAIEGIFADLMVHQVALLDGVMQGVRAMLDELSPENLERGLKAERGALGLAVGRHKALWHEYQRRYEALCEEKQAFLRIFGREFTEAYHEYRRRGADAGERGTR